MGDYEKKKYINPFSKKTDYEGVFTIIFNVLIALGESQHIWEKQKEMKTRWPDEVSLYIT